jgi:hypothetical protein
VLALFRDVNMNGARVVVAGLDGINRRGNLFAGGGVERHGDGREWRSSTDRKKIAVVEW